MMKQRFPILAALMALAMPLICHANCSDLLRAGFEGDLIACKALPESPNKIIVASIEEPERLSIRIINNKTGEILSEHFDNDPSFSGSGRPLEVKIDTAPYYVAAEKRAFGVRIWYGLNSWESQADLSLYLMKENKISSILKGLTVYSLNNQIGRTACQGNPRIESESTVSISKEISEGLHDLVVTTKEQVSLGSLSNGKCVITSERPRIIKGVLKFHRGQYAIPKT